jgi:hypothetical protein
VLQVDSTDPNLVAYDYKFYYDATHRRVVKRITGFGDADPTNRTMSIKIELYE